MFHAVKSEKIADWLAGSLSANQHLAQNLDYKKVVCVRLAFRPQGASYDKGLATTHMQCGQVMFQLHYIVCRKILTTQKVVRGNLGTPTICSLGPKGLATIRPQGASYD
jgi:hypothetical protein